MAEYPSDWPCKNCKRELSKHLKPVSSDILQNRRWCFAVKDAEYDKASYQWFEPIDNLSYVEKLANDKQSS